MSVFENGGPFFGNLVIFGSPGWKFLERIIYQVCWVAKLPSLWNFTKASPDSWTKKKQNKQRWDDKQVKDTKLSFCSSQNIGWIGMTFQAYQSFTDGPVASFVTCRDLSCSPGALRVGSDSLWTPWLAFKKRWSKTELKDWTPWSCWENVLQQAWRFSTGIIKFGTTMFFWQKKLMQMLLVYKSERFPWKK